MDWKTASAYYAQRLDDVLTIRRYASNLARLHQVQQFGVKAEAGRLLQEEAEQAERQKKRLEKGEFRIAVVGLEKAGKSTFVNAWLGCDLLPAKSQRCTFTTTQIYSVRNETEQRLEINPKASHEFTQLCLELEAAIQGQDKSQAAKAEQDLSTIRKYQHTLQSVIVEGDRRIPFMNLDDIKDDLRKYVADESYAHAMREARLYTCKLAEAEGIVFYDVPGLDSGLSKHIEESREMLTDCDAVILIQRHPSLRGPEKDLIKFAREGDKHIGLEEKLFVFFGRIDSFPTHEAFRQDFETVIQEWREETNLSKDRIVGGSAGAHLILHAVADDETAKYVGSREDIAQKMNRVLMLNSSVDELKQQTGIPEIKSRMNTYLNTDRVAIVERRCKAMINSIVGQAEEIYRLVSAHCPEDPAEAKKQQERDRRLAFTHWFNQKKRTMRADMHNHFEKVDHSLQSNTLQTFRGRYEQVVKTKLDALSYRQEAQRNILFGSCSNPTFDPAEANFEWRKHLYVDVRQLINSVAEELAIELTHEARNIVEFMTGQLWGSAFVEKEVIGDIKVFESRLQYSLKALFLRFVRPVAEALIRAPLNSERRKTIVNEMERDIDMIDNYYPDQGEEIYRNFKRYLRYGVRLLTDEQLIKKELNSKVQPLTAILKSLRAVTDKITGDSDEIRHKREVVQEVEADLKALEYYLLNTIFNASGFRSFCQQEMENLRDRFYEMEQKDVWNWIANDELDRGNPLLLKELPAHIRPQEMDTIVSDGLRQLGVSLRNYQGHGLQPI